MDQLSKKDTKALLLVAHPDDEIIFCGGTLLSYPRCQWHVVCMTDDGREEAFERSIAQLKQLGVNIVFHKNLRQQNIDINAQLTALAAEQTMWAQALAAEQISADIVITHSAHGDYGHAAHKLASAVVDSLYPNVWKFIYPIETATRFAERCKIRLTPEILKKKVVLFVENYPSEQYIWQALGPLMDFYFTGAVETFGRDRPLAPTPKKKILVILPDRFVNATGGIGANSGPVFEILSAHYDFYVVGHPLAGTAVPTYIKGYQEVFNPYTEVKSPIVGIPIAQLGYFAQALHFPKPDLVLAFDWSIYLAATQLAQYWQVPLVARMSMSPILLSAQGYTFGLNLNNKTEKALHNLFCEMEIRGLKAADRIIQVSNAYEQRYRAIAPTYSAKTSVVIDGINFNQWQQTDTSGYQLPGANRTKIVFLGRLSEVKGIAPLCAAKVPAGIDLIFIGPKQTADAICWRAIEQKMAREPNVYYLDALYGADKIKALKSATALIMPSYHESFGGVALEGLAAGCVVLSSRAWGLRDFLNDTNSIACGTTPSEIEAAYQKLLNQSTVDRANMVEQGLRTAKKMSLESTARQLAAVFEDLIS